MNNLTQIWSGRDDFDQAAQQAIALTKPLGEPAPVFDIRSGERVR